MADSRPAAKQLPTRPGRVPVPSVSHPPPEEADISSSSSSDGETSPRQPATSDITSQANASFEALRHFHDARRHSLLPVAPLNRKLSTFTADALDAAMRGGSTRIGHVNHGVGTVVEGDSSGGEEVEGIQLGLEERFDAMRREHGSQGMGLGRHARDDSLSGDIGTVGEDPEPFDPHSHAHAVAAASGGASFDIVPAEDPASPSAQGFPTAQLQHPLQLAAAAGKDGHNRVSSLSKSSTDGSPATRHGRNFSPIAFRIGQSRRAPSANAALSPPVPPSKTDAPRGRGHGTSGGTRTLYGAPMPPIPTEKAPARPGTQRQYSANGNVGGIGVGSTSAAAAAAAGAGMHYGFQGPRMEERSAKTGMREPYMGVSLPEEQRHSHRKSDLDETIAAAFAASGADPSSSPENLGSIPDMLRRASGTSLQSLGHLLRRIEDADEKNSPNPSLVNLKAPKTKSGIDWRKRLLSLEIAAPIPENQAVPQFNISLQTGGQFGDDHLTAKAMAAQSEDGSMSPISSQMGYPILEKGEGWKERQSLDIKLDNSGPGIIHVGNPHRPDQTRDRLRTFLAFFTAVLSFVATLFYLSLRIKYTASTVEVIGAPYSSAWVFLIIEAIFSLSLSLAAIHSVVTHKRNITPRLRMRGEENLPIVDLCILAGGYSDAIVMDTVAAALSLDYPSSRYRILVIDNGDSRDLQRRVEMFRQSRPMNLTFHKVAWDPTDRRSAHARGNAIKFALNQRNGRGPGPFVAILDGDMIPELSFLRALVPHIINDPFVGMVTCPAAVYNLPQPLSQAVSTFVNVTTSDDGARSGILLRRSAITDVGGYPAHSTADDNALKTLLAGRGYASISLSEAIQCGTVPLSYRDGVKHAKELRMAPLRLAARATFFVGRKMGGLGVITRIRKAGLALKPFFGLMVLFSMIAFPVIYATGGILVPVLEISNLSLLIRAAFAVVASARLHELVWCSTSQTVSSRRRLQAWAFVAPYDLVAILSSMIPTSIRRQMPIESREREGTQDNMIVRLFKTTFRDGAWMHLVLICALFASVGVSLHATIERNLNGTYTLYQTGLVGLVTVFWPTLYTLDILFGLAVPFAYACFPPTPAFREDLIIRDQYTAVARPKHDRRAIAPFRVRKAGEIVISSLLVIYGLVLVIFTFVHISV